MISIGISVIRSENPEEDMLNNCNVDFLRIKRSNSGESEEYMDFDDYTSEEQDYVIRSLKCIIDTYRRPTVEEIKESK